MYMLAIRTLCSANARRSGNGEKKKRDAASLSLRLNRIRMKFRDSYKLDGHRRDVRNFLHRCCWRSDQRGRSAVTRDPPTHPCARQYIRGEILSLTWAERNHANGRVRGNQDSSLLWKVSVGESVICFLWSWYAIPAAPVILMIPFVLVVVGAQNAILQAAWGKTNVRTLREEYKSMRVKAKMATWEMT